MYSELLFGKPLTLLLYEDLVEYFRPAKLESNTLEFKSYVVKGEKGKEADKDRRERENAILKTICGFLNSEGGIIIWGTPEGVEVDIEGVKDKEFYGELTPVPVNIPKDQFIARVVNSITPSPAGVLYHQIPCEGGFIYLFEAARSLFPPHQFQNIYYMRLDGHTRAAPHHYIEALMKQIKSADINGFIRNDNSIPSKTHGIVPFVLNVHNFSKYITGLNVSYTLISDYGLVFYEEEQDMDVNKSQGRIDADVPIGKPLHYNMPFSRTFYIALPEREGTGEFNVKLITYADNSPAKISMYKYEVFRRTMSPTPQIRLKSKEENLLSFLHSDSLGKTEEERAGEADVFKLGDARYHWDKTPMRKILDP